MAGTPGHPKTGGRQKGTPNKRTAEVDRLIAEARGGRKPSHHAIDEMQQLAITLRSLAATQMDATMAELMDRASRAWERVANFRFPRFAAVHHTVDPLDLSKFTREQLVQLDGILAVL